MSTAIFLTPRDGGGYDIQLGEDHTRLADGHANLVVLGAHGVDKALMLGDGDWVQLRDHIDQMLNNRQETT